MTKIFNDTNKLNQFKKPNLIFTMDVEDWHHAENISKYVDGAAHSSLPMVYKVLDMLESKKAKGTFFTLGILSVKYKSLLQEIVNRGHEIASHGWNHQLIDNMNYQELVSDLKNSKDALEQASGKSCLGYRSPCFSSNELLQNALIDTGYSYSSCRISASFHDRYSNSKEKSKNISSDILKDFEIPSAKIFGKYFPATGGGYFRLFPAIMQKILLSKSSLDPIVFYCHPWDFDDSQPLHNVPRVARWRHSVGSSTAIKKLAKFNFENKTLIDLA